MGKIDIYLSINNRAEVIQLPVLPQDFEISLPNNNDIFETVSQGELRLIGLKGLKSLTINSFFPSKDYPFIRNDGNVNYKGYGFVKVLQWWMDRRVPIRVIITDTPINLAMTIDEFTYGERDGSGDVYYTLTLTEFRFIETRKMKR